MAVVVAIEVEVADKKADSLHKTALETASSGSGPIKPHLHTHNETA